MAENSDGNGAQTAVAAHGRRSPVERLLRRSRPYEPRRLSPRELRVEIWTALIFVLSAAAMPILVPSDRSFDPLLAVALVTGHVAASRIPLHVGAGAAVPTQVVVIPMLFLMPAATVPALVACSSMIAAGVDILRNDAHAERLITGVGDSWHSMGSAVLVGVAGEPDPDRATWPIVAGALFAQSAADLVAATAREWLGRGIAAALQLRVIASVALMDLSLTPIGMLAALASGEGRFGFMLVLPLLGLLAALASDRRERIAEIGARLTELRNERARLDDAIRRVGDALGSTLDRVSLADLALRTAVEALGAPKGRASLASGDIDLGAEDERFEAVIAEVVDTARRHHGRGTASDDGGRHAIGLAMGAGCSKGPADVLVVAREGRPFSNEEHALFWSLAGQARIAMENVALHDQLRLQATEDELTGLANHRRFQDVLARAAESSRRSGGSVALVMLDIDNFKAINDTHGHQQGDVVLREVARAVAGRARATDEPARYGGEELAVVLPGTDLDGGVVAAEDMRRAVEALELRSPDGSPLRVTVSAGVSELRAGDAGASALVAAADAALYEAKRGGKNRTVRGERAESGVPATPANAPRRRFSAASRG